MSRNKNSNDIVTTRKQVKIGKKVYHGTEPVALVGPEQNRDIISLNEFAEALYGPGCQCVIIPPSDKAGNL